MQLMCICFFKAAKDRNWPAFIDLCGVFPEGLDLCNLAFLKFMIIIVND